MGHAQDSRGTSTSRYTKRSYANSYWALDGLNLTIKWCEYVVISTSKDATWHQQVTHIAWLHGTMLGRLYNLVPSQRKSRILPTGHKGNALTSELSHSLPARSIDDGPLAGPHLLGAPSAH